MLTYTSLPRGSRLMLGAIGRASALTLAGILTSMLLVAAALSLTVVLSLAGVLGEGLGVVFRHHTGDSWRNTGDARVTDNRLCVGADCGAAHKAGKSCCEC